MKKTKTIFMCAAVLFSVCTKAQTFTETPVPVVEDTITKIAKLSGNGVTWDFTSLNFTKYPQVNDSDLVELQSPEAVYDNANFVNLNDSVADNLPSRQMAQSLFTINRKGSYTAQYAGNGTLNIPGTSYTNVDKIKIVETYYLISDPDTISRYSNSYYAYFKKSDKTYLFSVFNKNRVLKGNLGFTYYGIAYNAVTSSGQTSVFTDANLQMVLNPNPASGQTTLSYNLVANANLTIMLSNQAGTVNNTIFTGNKTAGANQQTISLTGLQSGLYNVSMNINGSLFSTSLIIQ